MSSLANVTVKACHERQLTRRTLKHVNKIRVRLGLKPVKYLAKGALGENEGCSIAATLTTKYTSALVTYGHIEVSRYQRVNNERGDVLATFDVLSPGYVDKWIARFDNGTYKALKA